MRRIGTVLLPITWSDLAYSACRQIVGRAIGTHPRALRENCRARIVPSVGYASTCWHTRIDTTGITEEMTKKRRYSTILGLNDRDATVAVVPPCFADDSCKWRDDRGAGCSMQIKAGVYACRSLETLKTAARDVAGVTAATATV